MACGCNKRRNIKRPLTKQTNQQQQSAAQTNQQKTNEK